MNQTRFSLSFVGVVALASMAFSPVSFAGELPVDCGAEAKKVTAAVSADPENVLKIVAKEVKEAPSCVCEIVKSAIIASKADKATVVAIVTTASEILPDETPTVIACAVNAAPEASRAIADKFGSLKGVVANGEESGSTVKETDNNTPPVEPEQPLGDDFNLFESGIGGIYLTAPGSGLSNGGFLPAAN
jgi:hypothetical protein